MSKKKKKTTIDLEDGRRVFVFGCVVICSLLLAHMIALVLVATSTIPRVPRSAIKAYGKCVSLAKKSRERRACKVPAPVKSKGSSAKILDAGPYPWIAVIVVFLFCGIFYIIQSQQDYQRFREVMALGSTYVNKNMTIPASVESAVGRITGAVATSVETKVQHTTTVKATDAIDAKTELNE